MDEEKLKKEIKNGILEIPLNSWKGFSEFVANRKLCSPTHIFRGQANSEWLVESTLDRMEKRFPTKPNLSGAPRQFSCPRVERELQLDRFKEMARGKLTNPPKDGDENEWWALAQHHGLVTPMLDWTYSPFVALFFAFEEEKCWCEGKEEKEYKEPKSRAVFALVHCGIKDKEKKENPAPHPFSPKGHTSYRLVNQGGVFLKMPEPKHENGTRRHIDLEAYVRENFPNETYVSPKDASGGKAGTNTHPNAILKKLVISNEDRVECLKYLDHMNINRASLFPDLDGAARYVNDLWEVNWDKAIGHINQE